MVAEEEQVQHAHVMAVRKEFGNQHGADVTGPAGDENIHCLGHRIPFRKIGGFTKLPNPAENITAAPC